jgi:FkbM family methyltransferase
MLIKQLLKDVLRSGGFEISRIATSDYLLRGRLSQLIEKLQINTVLDVGANNGQYLHLLSKIGFKGEVLSFEPVPELYRKIKTLFPRKKQWQQFPYACGSQDGTAVIHVAKSSDFSSILKANAFCLKENPGASPVRSEPVQVRRLDAFIQELYSDISKRRILLKIDTQGYDREVFSGARGILDSIKLLQVEIPVIPLYEKALSMPRALDIYLSAGFGVSGLFPVWYSNDRIFVGEYDCLLVNQRMSSGLEQEQAPVPASLP